MPAVSSLFAPGEGLKLAVVPQADGGCGTSWGEEGGASSDLVPARFGGTLKQRGPGLSASKEARQDNFFLSIATMLWTAFQG